MSNIVARDKLGKEFKDEEPLICCSGHECGCMGIPIEPIVCSHECYEKLINRQNNYEVNKRARNEKSRFNK